ncbi:MAG: TonB-dependent receptor, partial [Rhizobiales bacterium 32-66-8]
MPAPSSRRLLRALNLTTALVGAPLAALCLSPLASPSARAQGAPDLPTVQVQPDLPSTGETGSGWGTYVPFLPADTATISARIARQSTLSNSDSGSLISRVPGGAAWGAGGVSSLPAVNGMGADRVQITINNMLFSPACPNEMTPPLSFVNPNMIASMRVYMGTAPVSVGGDYTGAKVDVTVAPPQFTPGQALTTSGSASGFYRSNGNSYGVDFNATVSNEDSSVSYTGGWARASDYTSGNGTTIKSTMYETQNHALSISKKLADNIFTFEIGGQFIPYQGFVNQYMDMVDN